MKKALYKQRQSKPVPDQFEGLIFLMRERKVMFDSDLAALYGVTTKALNQAVKRNPDRFPEDFMFQLTDKEADLLRSQFVTSNTVNLQKALKSGRKSSKSADALRSQFVTSNVGRGGRRHVPYAFTEQGVAMLSSVLRSRRAVKVNIEIMRTFIRLRQLLAANSNLERRLAALEQECGQKFKMVFDAIRELLQRPDPIQPEHGREIGFHSPQALQETAPPYRCFTSVDRP